MRRSLASCLLLLLLMCLPSVAAAAPPAKGEVQVLTLISPDAFKHAKALSDALRLAISNEGWKLRVGDFSMEVLTAALACPEPPDEPCLKKIAGRIKYDRYIWGTLGQVGDDIVAHVRFFEKGKNVSESRVRYHAKHDSPADPELQEIANNVFAELRGEPRATLLVRLDGGAQTGTVTIDGKAAGKLEQGSGRFPVPAKQPLKVVIEVPGAAPIEREVTLESSERHELVVAPQLALKPRQKEKVATGPTKSSAGVPVRRVLGWSAVGVGAALAVVGGVFWIDSFSQKQSSEWKAQLEQTPSNRNPCEYNASQSIKDLCSSNSRSRLLATVLMPVGAVLAGVGAVVLLTEPSKQGQERVRRFTPALAVGPTGGQFDLTLAF